MGKQLQACLSVPGRLAPGPIMDLIMELVDTQAPYIKEAVISNGIIFTNNLYALFSILLIISRLLLIPDTT